jgi:hypothetical protein
VQVTGTSDSRMLGCVLGPIQGIPDKCLDRVQNKAAKFRHHTGGLEWESLAKRRKIARVCALFKAYRGTGRVKK